jgi:glycosyltransferase involved in cell wall biosynthesis
MRLIFYIPYYRHGGVERVIVSLINEISQQIDLVIVVASPSIIDHFQKIIPRSSKVVYETFRLGANQRNIQLSILHQITNIVNKISITSSITNYLKRLRNNYQTKLIFQTLINQYNATHCLYAIGNRVQPPSLSIPVFMISYDLFWHFSPLTYQSSFINGYDKYLLLWLNTAKLILTISEKTRQDILSLFPQYQAKVKAIPLAGFGEKTTSLNTDLDHNNCLYFFFPSSLGIYKDHLTLLKAGIILAQKNLNFQIVLIGKETDKFIQGNISLSQQNKTKEYLSYLQEWQLIYTENQAVINNHFLGLGYCDDNDLESWYQKSSCVVFPSQYEGFGLGIAEAIMRGIPVIASDLEVFAEQVELYQCPDRVTFFARGNEVDLATKMESFINNPLPKLSGEKLEFYRQLWTWKQVAQKYIELMSDV